MDILTFSQRNRLRVRRDTCGDLFIPGKFGTISEYGGDVFALSFLADASDKGRDNILRSRARRALAAGLQPSQIGDFEGVLLFDSSDHAHARLAIRLAGIKRRRRQTGKGRPFMSERVKELARIRLNHAGEGPGTAQKHPIKPRDKELVEVAV